MLFAFLRALGLADCAGRSTAFRTERRGRRFAEALQEHVRPRASALRRGRPPRLEENPLRLFDSKDPETRRVLEGAPATLDFLDESSRAHHEELKRLLPLVGVPFRESAALVRGSTTTR